jgi:hypothetical protein
MLQSAQVGYDAPGHCVNEGVQTDLAGGTATGGVYSGAGVTDHETVLLTALIRPQLELVYIH